MGTLIHEIASLCGHISFPIVQPLQGCAQVGGLIVIRVEAFQATASPVHSSTLKHLYSPITALYNNSHL